MSNYLLGAVPYSIPKPPSGEKVSEDQATNKTAPQTSVTFVYQAKVAGSSRNVTVTWCKNLIHHSLSLLVETPSDGTQYTCKIDLKTWQFWGKKGLKSFEVDGKRVDIFWDFRQAKFSSTPEPYSDYYVAMVSGEEVVLLLGDLKKEAYKRTRSRPCLEDAILLYKKENVYGKRLFSTRTILADAKKEHCIVIESSLSGPDDPEMWISIDGEVAIRIMNLNWRFRGNETVMVNDLPVQIFWDVHDWLFSSPKSGHALFIFKPGAPECVPDSEPDGINCSSGDESDSRHGRNCSSGDEGDDRCEWPKRNTLIKGYCHFLYAWKTE